MTITGKHTQIGMESLFFVPKRHLLDLVPEELSLASTFGIGKIIIGAWKHSNTYVDDRSYGPALEAWVAIVVKHHGEQCGFMHTTYNNNPSYAEPVNNIFKFTKVHAEIAWRERDGSQEIEVRKDEKLALRFSGKPTFIPTPIPFSRPRISWLKKEGKQYLAEIKMSAGKSRIAFTKVEIPSDSPIKDVAHSLKWITKYSIFFEDASIEIPEPKQV